MARTRVIIVGAGFGGLAAAKALARADAEIIVIDRTNHHLFQPLLYQVATAALSPSDVATPVRTLLRRQSNATMLMGEVVDVDLASRQVRLADGQALRFDWLVAAPGAAYSFFGHPDWAEHALVLKSLEDALEIRSRLLSAFEKAELASDPAQIEALMTFVVIGAGPTGVETAGTIAEMARQTLRGEFRRIDPSRARVVLLEAGPRVLPAFSERLSRYAAKALADLGVEVRLNASVDAISAGRVGVAGAVLQASAILWCAGVEARPAATWLGVPAARNGAVMVDALGAAPGLDRVFAIGDVASQMVGGRPLPGLAPVAKQQGRWVGRLIAARLAGRADPPPFRYRDWGTLAVIGRSRAVAVLGPLRLTGVLAWWTWSLVHLMLLVDFRSRLTVYLNWTWAWFTRGRGARLLSRLR